MGYDDTLASVISGHYREMLEDAILKAPLLWGAFLEPEHTVKLPPIQGPKRYAHTCECGNEHYDYSQY